MINGKRILAYIPARSGSKSIKDKNIVNLGGIPLIAHSILAAKTSKYVDRLIVSTDSLDYAKVALSFGAEIPFIRPAELATDTACEMDTTLHLIDWVERTGERYDYIMKLEPTSPLRTTEDVDRAIEKIEEKQCDSVITITDASTPLDWVNTLPSDGSMIGFRKKTTEGLNRQEMPRYYQLDGLVYVAKWDQIKFKQSWYEAETSFASITPKDRAVDIDSPTDLELAKVLVEKNPPLHLINYLNNNPGSQNKVLHKGRVSGKALKYLKEVVDYGFGNSSGPGLTKRFERAFAEKIGASFGVAHCNGTATLHSCLAAVGVKPGDEVIVPPLTAAATSFCVLHQGAIPVYADIDEKTFNIDPKSIRERITPRTKAIIPVHLYGLPADMDPIMEIAKEYGLAVIEDSAECFGGTYKGRMAGTIGHAASFSLQASKHLTCGDGGIVVTNDEELATKVRKFTCFGSRAVGSKTGGVMSKKDRGDPDSIRYDSMGWNYRMSDLQGAVALEQTERFDELVEKRKQIGVMFEEAIKGCSWLIPQYTPPGYVNSYWTFVCCFEAKQAGCSWQEFRQKFYSLGGDFFYGAWRLTYNELTFQKRNFLGGFFPIDSEIYKGQRQEYKPGLCPVAEKLQPKLMHFKTNYMDLEEAKKQVQILKKTIELVEKERQEER
jgi:perosamine synthetase